MWHPDHVPFCDHIGVLLQYDRFNYSIPQFVTRVRGIRMVVTPDIVSEVLHVPRVVHPDYPSCDRLRTMSKDELSSLFCETPSSWGDR